MSFGTWRNKEWEEKTDEERNKVRISWRQTTVYLCCKCENSSCGHPRFRHPSAAGQTNNTRATSGSLFKQHTEAVPHQIEKLRLGILYPCAARRYNYFILVDRKWYVITFWLNLHDTGLSVGFRNVLLTIWNIEIVNFRHAINFLAIQKNLRLHLLVCPLL